MNFNYDLIEKIVIREQHGENKKSKVHLFCGNIYDYSFVSRMPSVQLLIGCSMYAPLRSLPSQCLPALKIPEHCYYRPSWADMTKMEQYCLTSQNPFGM